MGEVKILMRMLAALLACCPCALPNNSALAQKLQFVPSSGQHWLGAESTELPKAEFDSTALSPIQLVGFLEDLKNDDAAVESTTSSVEQRLSKLEKTWERQQADAEKKKADAAGKPSLKINGRIHLDYWNFADTSPGIGFFEHPDSMDDNFGADPEDRIFFRRIRLNLKVKHFIRCFTGCKSTLIAPKMAK